MSSRYGPLCQGLNMCYNEELQKEAKFQSKTLKFFLVQIIF